MVLALGRAEAILPGTIMYLYTPARKRTTRALYCSREDNITKEDMREKEETERSLDKVKHEKISRVKQGQL